MEKQNPFSAKEYRALQKRVWTLELQLEAATEALKLIAPNFVPGSLTSAGVVRSGLRRAATPKNGGRSAAAVEFTGCVAMLDRLARREEATTAERKGGRKP